MRTVGDLLHVLGNRMPDPTVTRVLQQLGEQPNVETIEDETYYEFPRSGIALVVATDGMIHSINLYSDGRDGYSAFQGECPAGLRLQHSCKGVRETLGAPTMSGGGESLPILGPVAFWDRYDLTDHVIHVEYSADGESISMITLMTAETAPTPDIEPGTAVPM